MRAAIILCAGLGTRLRPLTDWVAKPIVPIGDRPAVEHIATRIESAGIERLVVNVHHRPQELRRWAEPRGVFVSSEPDLLGTAGGVARAAALLGDGDVLVWNGDIACELDVGALASAHRGGGAAATLAVAKPASGRGNVGLGADGRIVRLRDASFAEEVTSADYVGIHVLGGALRATLPSTGCLVRDVWIPALGRGLRLDVHPAGLPFIDVGTLEAYAEANRTWLARRCAASWAHPSAAVTADIAGSVIGPNAIVAADAIDCIVWSGAEVLAPVRDAVVTAHGVAQLNAAPPQRRPRDVPRRPKP